MILLSELSPQNPPTLSHHKPHCKKKHCPLPVCANATKKIHTPELMQTAARRIALSNSSSPLASRAYVESSDALNRSKGHWCQRSFGVASVPSSSSGRKNAHRRVSKEERRALVEAFVERYRASNAGKFPRISHTRQEVGGSHYTVRQIILELEYNHKVAPPKTIKETQLGEVENVIYPNLNVKEESSVSEAGSINSHHQSVEPVNLDEGSLTGNGEAVGLFDAKQAVISTDSGADVADKPIIHLTEEIYHSSEQIEEGVSCHRVCDSKIDIEIQENNAPASDSTLSQEPIGAKEGDEHRSIEEASIPEEVASDETKALDEGSPSPERSSIWGNLKSLADGIISFWKKM